MFRSGREVNDGAATTTDNSSSSNNIDRPRTAFFSNESAAGFSPSLSSTVKSPVTSSNSNTNSNNNTNNNNESSRIISMKQQIKASKLRRHAATAATTTTPHSSSDDIHILHNQNHGFRKAKKYHVRDPLDSDAAGQLVSLITPIRPSTLMDITGTSTTTAAAAKALKIHANNTNASANSNTSSVKPPNKVPSLTNECLLAIRVKSFDFTGGTTTTTTSAIMTSPKLNINPKSKNKIRYIFITRSTNHILIKNRKKGKVLGGSGGFLFDHHYNSSERYDRYNDHGNGDDDSDGDNEYGRSKSDDDDDNNSDNDDDDNESDGYDTLYNPENDENDIHNNNNKKKTKKVLKKTDSDDHTITSTKQDRHHSQHDNYLIEQSSFPNLVCMAIHSDGTHPDVRKILPLDQLVSIENLGGTGSGATGGMNDNHAVQLVFQNGTFVEIDFDLKVNTISNSFGGGSSSSGIAHNFNHATESALQKERFLWSLLQIHAILCTSVMERNLSLTSITSDVVVSATTRSNTASSTILSGGNTTTTALPPLTMRNIDRAELQYVSTVNGFLSDSPVLCALLERHRNATIEKSKAMSGVGAEGGRGGGGQLGNDTGTSSEEKSNAVGEMAYDMIMGNFSNLTLFLTEEEKQDAEEVLNSTFYLEGSGDGKINSKSLRNGNIIEDEGGKVIVDEISTAETLTGILQKRMRDLEAETCRRLIAWEDEKYYNSTGNTLQNNRDTMDALSISVLFKTLDELDETLDGMEEWLSDKVAAVKPITDECREVEEENRQLGFQRKSYTLISSELKRLLDGLQVSDDVKKILRDPTSKMVYHSSDKIDIVESQAGVEDIYRAGRSLKEAFDRVQDEGGVHLRGVRERVEALLGLSDSFCESITSIIIAVMEGTVAEINKNDEFDYLSSAHTQIGKAIRTIQRHFQQSLLAYVQLNEVLALLKPSKLPFIRQTYSQFVADGILTKRRLKCYFASLPNKASLNTTSFTNDLKDYATVTVRSNIPTEPGTANVKPVDSRDIDKALSELLPVIAREAYFTAALFGLSAKHLSSREKRRNFEQAKKSVDHSTQYFRYYMSRICGIASEVDAEGKKVDADAMVSLVASTLLNDAMDGYIDRQKKGGDHSLSLAYVRATILDLRKKVDKQWVAWVENQIKWIKTNPEVPKDGKRAGIFAAIARFPSYLDHVMKCVKSGRPSDQIPNLSKIKVIAYYLQKMAGALFNSLHECSERDSTDQEYAANVMRMENSYFFTQTIKERGPEMLELFQKQVTAASSICKQSTDAYLGFMIKREFKSLHTMFANISRVRREVGDADVPIHVPRSTFEKTLAKECSKEILKEKIESMYYRLQKHLSVKGGLLHVAWKALVKVLYEWVGRWEKLSLQCYNITLTPNASDVVRIAKQAAGITSKSGRRVG